MPPLNLYARVRFSLCSLHTRPRVQRAPGFPCSLFGGECFCKPRANHAARRRRCILNELDHSLAVIARLDRQPSTPRLLGSIADVSGILDRPVIGERKRRRPADVSAGRRQVGRGSLKIESRTPARRQPWPGDHPKSVIRQFPRLGGALVRRRGISDFLLRCCGAGALDHRRLHHIR